MKKLTVASVVVGAALICTAPFSLRFAQDGHLVLSADQAGAVIGRPFSPLSIAGVHRRAYRRGYGAYGYGSYGYYGYRHYGYRHYGYYGHRPYRHYGYGYGGYDRPYYHRYYGYYGARRFYGGYGYRRFHRPYGFYGRYRW